MIGHRSHPPPPTKPSPVCRARQSTIDQPWPPRPLTVCAGGDLWPWPGAWSLCASWPCGEDWIRVARIVVGVDGSASSLKALKWAANRGRIPRRLGCDVVHAWLCTRYPLLCGHRAIPLPGALRGPGPPRSGSLGRRAQSSVTIRPDRSTSRAYLRSTPTKALLGASDGSMLIVVSSRGRGGFHGVFRGPPSASTAGGTTPRARSSSCAVHDSHPEAISAPQTSPNPRTNGPGRRSPSGVA